MQQLIIDGHGYGLSVGEVDHSVAPNTLLTQSVTMHRMYHALFFNYYKPEYCHLLLHHPCLRELLSVTLSSYVDKTLGYH